MFGGLQMTEHDVTMNDIGKELLCTVSTATPAFSEEAALTLHVIGTYMP